MNDEDQLKLLLIRDKGFLRELYLGPNLLKNRRLLFSSDNSKLNTLIKYLHFLVNGKIDINETNFEAIKTAKKLKFLQNQIEKELNYYKLLNAEREIKLKFLLKLSSIYPNLLYPLFNLE